MSAACPAHIIILVLIEIYGAIFYVLLWPALLGPNILLMTLVSRTCNVSAAMVNVVEYGKTSWQVCVSQYH